jgi:hypothetical protein
LKKWWKESIVEGLRKNLNMKPPKFKFEMVYWADLLYKHNQHNDDAFDFDNLYNEEPYLEANPKALKEYTESWLDEVKAATLGVFGSTLDSLKQHFGIDFFADWILSKVLKDLAFYYDDDRKIKNRLKQMEIANKVLKDELKNTLEKFKDNEIMLIAHSMGSIIAYDVLRDLGRSDNNDISIKYFITIGSPLGIPHVKHKIIDQRKYDVESKRVRTPTIVTGDWINYADKKDPVAIDFHLSDDYGENGRGIRVVDDLVSNDYIGLKGKNNNHKSYGYLRTPEISRKIVSFLS